MIGQLRGTLAHKQPPLLVIDVNGVGYELEAPMSTFYTLPAVGQPITLVTHLVVREDAHLLFGFASRAERALFRDLIKVSGVGARLDRAALRARLLAPERFNPETVMPSYGRDGGFTRVAAARQGRPLLTPAQVDDVVAWLAAQR